MAYSDKIYMSNIYKTEGALQQVDRVAISRMKSEERREAHLAT